MDGRKKKSITTHEDPKKNKTIDSKINENDYSFNSPSKKNVDTMLPNMNNDKNNLYQKLLQNKATSKPYYLGNEIKTKHSPVPVFGKQISSPKEEQKVSIFDIKKGMNNKNLTETISIDYKEEAIKKQEENKNKLQELEKKTRDLGVVKLYKENLKTQTKNLPQNNHLKEQIKNNLLVKGNPQAIKKLDEMDKVKDFLTIIGYFECLEDVNESKKNFKEIEEIKRENDYFKNLAEEMEAKIKTLEKEKENLRDQLADLRVRETKYQNEKRSKSQMKNN